MPTEKIAGMFLELQLLTVVEASASQASVQAKVLIANKI